MFFYPYYYRFSKSQGNRINDLQTEANEIYLNNAIRNEANLDGLNVLFMGYNGPLLFYKYKLHEAGQEIELHTDTNSLLVGDKVLVCKDEHREELNQKFDLVEIDRYQYAEVYLLK